MPESTLQDRPALPTPDESGTSLLDLALGAQLGRWRQAAEQEREVLAARPAAMAPALAGARQALETPRPAPPPLPTLSEPPSVGLRAFLAPVEGEPPEASLGKFIHALGILATGISGMARGDARAGLAALKGAMEGWSAGDATRADRAFADWQARTRNALDKWGLERTRYQDILAEGNQSVERMMGRLKLAALEQDNQHLAVAFATGVEKQALDELGKIQSHADQVGLRLATLLDARAKGQEALRQKELDRDLRRELEASREATQREIAKLLAQGRREMRQEIPLIGEWFDRSTGERAYPTRGQLLEAGPEQFAEQFHKSNTAGITRYEQISIALPMVKRLRTLADKLLADQPVQNLVRAIELNTQGKLAASEDLREFQALVEDVNVKMTSIMGPGQFRVRLMDVLRQVGLHARDTKATARSVLDQWETNIDNDLRAITGQKLREHLRGPWQGWALSPEGQRKWVRVPQGERIEPGWITLEETK